jgi:hypothetical protein
MILKSTLYSNFSGLDSSKASFILLPMDENTQQNHLKRMVLLSVRKKTTKPAGYSTIVVVLSCYQMLQTYARNVKLEALALKCFQMVKKLGF